MSNVISSVIYVHIEVKIQTNITVCMCISVYKNTGTYALAGSLMIGASHVPMKRTMQRCCGRSGCAAQGKPWSLNSALSAQNARTSPQRGATPRLSSQTTRGLPSRRTSTPATKRTLRGSGARLGPPLQRHSHTDFCCAVESGERRVVCLHLTRPPLRPCACKYLLRSLHCGCDCG
jgi:hypothetical protein